MQHHTPKSPFGSSAMVKGERSSYIPHPDVRFKQHPFYNVLDLIIRPTTLCKHKRASCYKILQSWATCVWLLEGVIGGNSYAPCSLVSVSERFAQKCSSEHSLYSQIFQLQMKPFVLALAWVASYQVLVCFHWGRGMFKPRNLMKCWLVINRKFRVQIIWPIIWPMTCIWQNHIPPELAVTSSLFTVESLYCALVCTKHSKDMCTCDSLMSVLLFLYGRFSIDSCCLEWELQHETSVPPQSASSSEDSHLKVGVCMYCWG